MPFAHEKLDVYNLAIKYVAWVFEQSKSLSGISRHARDQWLRASQSIPLNIAEGNGRFSEGDRRRFFEIARGSVLECAAIQDVLYTVNELQKDENDEYKQLLDRIAAMLTKLGGRGYCVRDEEMEYKGVRIESDGDSDTDGDSDL